MKVFLLIALVACAYAAPAVEVENDECDLGELACAELAPMPWLGSSYFEVTDDQLNWLVEQKLKALKWIVGKIPTDKVREFIAEFVKTHRTEIVDALKRGGRKLISMLSDLVKKMWAKIKDGSVKNWFKDKWSKLKEKLGDEEQDDVLEDMVQMDEEDEECEASLGEKACGELAPMPWVGANYFLTDDQLVSLVNAKLKAFSWLVGKIGGEGAEKFVEDFIEKHRDYITEALTKGGRRLISALKKIVKGWWEKVKDGSAKQWIKDKWGKLKEKLGDELEMEMKQQ